MTEITVNAVDSKAMPLDYRRLLGRARWMALPPATRERFRKHTAVYRGVMNTMRSSRVGRVLALLAWPFGAPLPLGCGQRVPATVTVEEDDNGAGSIWTRCYQFGGRWSHPIRSVKCLDRHGDLTERLGGGLRMRLRLSVRDGDLHFDSDGYYLDWLGFRIWLPNWFLPGRTRVTHSDLGNGRFRFTLLIHHDWLGELFYQDGVFTS